MKIDYAPAPTCTCTHRYTYTCSVERWTLIHIHVRTTRFSNSPFDDRWVLKRVPDFLATTELRRVLDLSYVQWTFWPRLTDTWRRHFDTLSVTCQNTGHCGVETNETGPRHTHPTDGKGESSSPPSFAQLNTIRACMSPKMANLSFHDFARQKWHTFLVQPVLPSFGKILRVRVGQSIDIHELHNFQISSVPDMDKCWRGWVKHRIFLY